MEFNIISNAMDSLNEAIDYYKNGKKYNDERCFKFCILLLCHGAELLLKEVLYEQHKIFVFENIDEVKNETEQTVGFTLALKRIKNICGIDLGRYYTYLHDLSKIRNQIQHYKFSVTMEHCNKIIIESFSAIEYIVYHILNKSFDDFDDVITSEQIEYLHEDKDVYNKRKQDIAKDISDHKLQIVGIEYNQGKCFYTPCPYCLEETLVLAENYIICKFCGRRFESIKDIYDQDYNCIIESHMRREIGRRKHLITYAVYECENCGNETLIYSIVEEEWVCLVCGNKISNTICCDDCAKEIPYCNYNYVLAQSYYDTENFHYLCKECSKKLKESGFGCEYEFS